MGDGDHDILVGIEVLGVEFVGAEGDFGASGVAVLGLHLGGLGTDDGKLLGVASEDHAAAGDELLELVVFRLELFLLQSGELAQAHLHDGGGLDLREVESGHQLGLGVIHALGMAYDTHDLVDDVYGLEEAFQDVGTLQGLVQLELGAAHDHFVAELHEIAYHLLQGEGAGTALDQGHVVDGETGLKGGVFEEHVEHHVGVGAHLQGYFDAYALAVGEFKQVGYAFDLLVADKLADVGDHVFLVHHVGNFGHHDGLAAVVGHFDFGLGTHHHPAAAGVVGVDYALAAHYDAACREVGALDVLHQFLGGDVGIVDVGADGVADFSQVVGRHVRGHTHGDAAGTVEHEQRELGGEHGGLIQGIVEVGSHVDGVLVEVGENVFRHFGKLGLSVSHGRHRVAVHGAEVALAEHQGVALVPGLGEARHCVIDA